MSKLLPGENLVLKEHPHWITFVRSLILPIVLVALVVVSDFAFLGPTGLNAPDFAKILTLIVVALAILWLVVVWIRWQSTTYTLTDQRIKIESGVFGRQEKVIPIDRVQDCTTRQSVFGRILGYGRVEVDAAGAQGAEILENLPKPGDFRDQVFMQSEKRRGGPESAPPPVPANPSGI
jgi:uncharacterized membrane protein YdbT with pleckstrin-like domain